MTMGCGDEVLWERGVLEYLFGPYILEMAETAHLLHQMRGLEQDSDRASYWAASFGFRSRRVNLTVYSRY